MSRFMTILVAALVAVAVALPAQRNEDFDASDYAEDTVVGHYDSVEKINVFQNSRIVDCNATDAFHFIPGMKEWCVANCFHVPPFCPSLYCQCW